MRLTDPSRRGALVVLAAVAFSLAFGAAGGGIQAGGQPRPSSLAGTSWRVTGYNDQGTFVAVLPETQLTARFGAVGLVSGETGCNSYSASYSIDGSALAIGPIATTLRACLSEAAAAQEQAFVTALSLSTQYAFAGDQLTLSDATGGTQLELLTESSSLGGAPWQVTSYNNGRGAVVSVVAGSELTALFGDDGLVSGNSGCNDYRATYSVDGRTIAIGPIATTRLACSTDELATQESLFLTALGASTRFELAGDKLTLRNADGAAQVVLVRPVAQPAPVPAPSPAPAASPLDASYEIEGQWVTLVDGYAESEAAPGSASKIITQYFGNDATGDVDGDGAPDVAFLLTQTRGGSGVFFYVVVALNTPDGYVGTNGVLLGDRIAPQTTAIEDGAVIVNYADRGPDDPFTTPPSVGVTRVLYVVDGRLVEQ
jgi:heat shock protein HslJ